MGQAGPDEPGERGVMTRPPAHDDGNVSIRCGVASCDTSCHAADEVAVGSDEAVDHFLSET